MWSCPERQRSLQNYGKPIFVQPTTQGQLLGSIGEERFGVKGVERRHRALLWRHVGLLLNDNPFHRSNFGKKPVLCPR